MQSGKLSGSVDKYDVNSRSRKSLYRALPR